MYQPRCHLSQMDVMNYARLIPEKLLANKIFDASRRGCPIAPNESATESN